MIACAAGFSKPAAQNEQTCATKGEFFAQILSIYQRFRVIYPKLR